MLEEATIRHLKKKVEEAVKGKKLGKGLSPFTFDVIRAICLITQVPVAGLFSLTLLKLIKKTSNHRAVIDWLDTVFRTVWSNSEKFRRIQGVRVQVKGR